MGKCRLAILSSVDGGSSLAEIAAQVTAGIIPRTEIVVVLTDRPCPLIMAVADRLEIKAHDASRPGGKNSRQIEKDIIDLLKYYAVDKVYQVGFLGILTEEFEKHFPDHVFVTSLG